MKRIKEEIEKKYNYKIIIGLLLGLVIGSIGVYAATQIASSNVTYTNNNQENVQGAIDDLFKKTKIIKQGDYISLTPTASTYTIPASETGYSENQTINPSELTLWRVISVTTDGIEVVSDKVSSTNVAFGTSQSNTSTIDATNPNVIAYAKFIKTLNTIAAQYTDEVHVKSTRHMGYNSNLATEEITDTTSLISTTAPWTGSTGKTKATIENLGGGDLGYNVDYNLVKNIYGRVWAHIAPNTTTRKPYWMASRGYGYNSSTYWEFGGKTVDNYGYVGTQIFYYRSSSGWNFNSKAYAIRPILTLNPDITVASGTGKETDPYVLT